MRQLYPLVGRYFAHGTPELTMVIGADVLKARFDAPFDLSALADGLPTRPFVAAHP